LNIETSSGSYKRKVIPIITYRRFRVEEIPVILRKIQIDSFGGSELRMDKIGFVRRRRQ